MGPDSGFCSYLEVPASLEDVTVLVPQGATRDFYVLGQLGSSNGDPKDGCRCMEDSHSQSESEQKAGSRQALPKHATSHRGTENICRYVIRHSYQGRLRRQGECRYTASVACSASPAQAPYPLQHGTLICSGYHLEERTGSSSVSSCTVSAGCKL